MKTKLASLLLAGLTMGAAAIAVAGPVPGYYETLRRAAQFRQLQAGETVLSVCNQCQTLTEQAVASPARTMGHCREGSAVTCPSCQAKVKVTLKPQQFRHDATKVTSVVYTNEKGEECLFVAKVADRK